MRFHHLGVACEEIESTLKFVEQTQEIISRSEIIYDPAQKATLCLITTAGGISIELISGPVVGNLIRKNINLYHTCWEVDDFDKTIDDYVSSGSLLLSEPKKAVMFDNKRVAFLSSPLGVIEFLES